ncbi:MAG: hypothetical protein JEZ06_06410 [Anaerolineaceae bacterium]|nr:hypothetical protein [Anaerolineaceae bacterium]
MKFTFSWCTSEKLRIRKRNKLKKTLHNKKTALDKIGSPKARPALVDLYKKDQTYQSGLWVLYNHKWELEFVVSQFNDKITDGEKNSKIKFAQTLVELYQDDQIPQSVKEQVLKQCETITGKHQDETRSEGSSHSDNGVSKIRTFDCTHDNTIYYGKLHTDKGVGVEFPLV